MTSTSAPRVSLGPIGLLFGGSWRLYKERFAELTEIMLLPVLALVLAEILLALGSFFAVLGCVIFIIGIVLMVFISLPLIYSIHHGTGTDASYHKTLRSFWPFAWLIILNGLAVFGGFFMLIIPGIWLAVALMAARYVFVIEDRRGMDALRQSKEYLKGYWWAVFGRSILFGFVSVIGTAAAEILFGIVFGKTGASIGGFAASLFLAPFGAVYMYKIFRNLQELKPELADVRTKTGKTFLTVSAIVGVVASIVIAAGLIAFSAAGSSMGFPHPALYRYLPPPRYGMQAPLPQ